MSYTDKVHLRYTHDAKEYAAAVRFYFLHSTEFMVRLIVMYVLMAGGLLLLNVVLDFLFPLWAIVAFIFLLGVSGAHGCFVDLPRRYFRDDPRFTQEYEVTFTDDRIEFKTQDMNSSVAWSFYTRAIETESSYIFMYGKKMPSFNVFPKRAFRDSQQEAAFREMVQRHLDHKLKLNDGEREKEYVPTSLQPPDWR